MNRRIADQGWGEAARQLCYKLAWLGGFLVRVDPRNTSRKCSRCGHTSDENRQTQAEFVCVQCCHAANADINVAINNEGRAGWARIACHAQAQQEARSAA